MRKPRSVPVDVTIGDVSEEDVPSVALVKWTGPWEPDDPDANFKAEVALYMNADPLHTVTNLARTLELPVGAVVRYVLAKWATEGSGGLLELGPRMVQRLNEVVDDAEAEGTDAARLRAYDQLRQMLGWLQSGAEQLG